MHLQARLRSPDWRWRVAVCVGGVAAANLVGGGLVFVLVRLVLPLRSADQAALLSSVNYLAFASYVPACLVLATAIGAWLGRPVISWLRRGGVPTAREKRMALHMPTATLLIQAACWVVGLALFTLLNLSAGNRVLTTIVATTVLGGVAACSIGYVWGERVLRPITARVMSAAVPDGAHSPGITRRILLIWALTTGIPVLGIGLVALGKMTGRILPLSGPMAVSALTLAVVALVVGLVGMTLVARSISDPVRQVSDAMKRVEDGDIDASVDVYDASEIGHLQAGFNRMVDGLAEREHLRDLFERHVGEDVARHAVERGSALGGEIREIAVLFVDVIGSTSLTESRPPDEVVELLNEFFDLAVDTVDHHGGFVNKFEGDAALAIFGAPETVEDAAGSALAAARELHAAVDTLEHIDVGIGVSAGPALAGNIGAAERFEYTVIGDPVNEAARLTDLAKKRPSGILASEHAVQLAGEHEAAQWRLLERTTLRGRHARTRLAEPVALADRAGQPGLLALGKAALFR